MGPSGAGHDVKGIHNAIEYALFQGYAEGLETLHASDYPLDLRQIAERWRHGSATSSAAIPSTHRRRGLEP